MKRVQSGFESCYNCKYQIAFKGNDLKCVEENLLNSARSELLTYNFLHSPPPNYTMQFSRLIKFTFRENMYDNGLMQTRFIVQNSRLFF